MHVLPLKWTLVLEPLYPAGNKYLEKARWIVSGVFQEAELDYDPYDIYAQVATHEAIIILLTVAVAVDQDLIIKGGDVSSAYLYGDIDCEVYMEQPTDCTGVTEKRGFVWKLNKLIYELRQARHIWGSLLLRKLI